MCARTPPRCGPAPQVAPAPEAWRSIALNAGMSARGERGTALTTTNEDQTTTATGVPVEETEEFEPLAARAPVDEDSPLFSELGVEEPIVRALSEVGITRTFAIQEMTLPIALPGSD